MNELRRSGPSSWVVFAIALGLMVGACGGDDDPGPAVSEAATEGDSTVSDDPAPDDGGEIAGSVTDDDLLMPRQYLQGEWCDSIGNSWIIEGDIARFEESASGGVGEFPVDVLFIDNPDSSLVSQTDDEFVIETRGEEVTYVRGSC